MAFPVPPVTPLCVDPDMALFTQGNQIVFLMGTALGKRDFMMHLFHRAQNSMFQALLTQRVPGYITVPDTFPPPPVMS